MGEFGLHDALFAREPEKSQKVEKFFQVAGCPSIHCRATEIRIEQSNEPNQRLRARKALIQSYRQGAGLGPHIDGSVASVTWISDCEIKGGRSGLCGSYPTEYILNQALKRACTTLISTHSATETSAFNLQWHKSGACREG